ncbi:tetratricopeptide repeat protein [Ruminococcus sp. XPD3002]|uniref:tetratricopeptide repeat protein n=1 Tax=Ruminococcus sp. XPD3002 TaxID=1452269 RepID=UPI000918B96D|nr:Sel1 repeat-containing protein [Ruminococcus flavefaciens]
MARKIKFPLKMKDGYDARSIEELREHFDLESVLGYFADGRLQTWLRDRYFDDEAQQVSELDPNDSELVTKICSILGVEAQEQAVNVDVHEINRYNEKRKQLLEKYPEPELLNNIDAVAFNEDDIIQIIEKGIKEIYLIDNEFEFPFEISDGKIVKKDGSPLPADIGISLYDCKFIGKGATLHIDSSAGPMCEIFRLEFENINFIFADEDLELFFKARILKDIDSSLEIAKSLYAGKEYKDAYDYFLLAAELGNPVAQSFLGDMYYYGQGVQEDYAEAAKLYRKAAELGNAYAQYSLGWMFDTGKGVTEDCAEAIEWYRKSAAQGYSCAQYILGQMYYYGRGVKEDYAEAVKWFRKAAEQGDVDAQNRLDELL